MIRGFDDQEPTVAESAYVDPAATVIGNVTIHADAPGERVLLEEHAAVGHNAIVHNATVGAHSLVGMGATVLDGATLDPYSVVAANSLVTEGTTVASETLVAGTPAEPIREGLDREGDFFATAARYKERVEGLRAGPNSDGPQ